ncbi:MAG TPA: hypothetical protein P5509_10865 [Bacteroidales bacterium]|nr:hypothetical protein [Bacteroidales bacterium]
MKNYYKTDGLLFQELCVDAKRNMQINGNRNWEQLASDNLKKTWFSIIESTGGAVTANPKGHPKAIAMYHIEQALSIIEKLK